MSKDYSEYQFEENEKKTILRHGNKNISFDYFCNNVWYGKDNKFFIITVDESKELLDYLWSDVSKLDHNVIFNNYKTFESLIKDYKNKGVKVFIPNIFEEKVAAHPQEEEENE